MSSFVSQLPVTALQFCEPPAAPHGGRSAFLHAAGVFPSWKSVITSSSPPLQCNAISRSRTDEYLDVIQNESSVIKRHDAEDDTQQKEEILSARIRELVESVRSKLQSMGDGEINISPYDTAWVALVEEIDGDGGRRRPQFPTSLEWISKNQLADGSWGDDSIFSIYDRILNTLACVVALRSWDMHPDKSDKGILFIKENIGKLEDENPEHMPIGFEVAFPSLIEIAKKLNIDIPDHSPGLQQIYASRELKLTRIPRDIMHKVPTTLLHSLEGLMGSELRWQELLNLQAEDGSFLFSPSSTAFALQQTKHPNCLNYLSKHVHKFDGGVPNVYPVDLFERLWAVDRLQRLGISRYFEPEIKECIDYVHRYWTDKGICWARNSQVQDIDDTAMGFRLMRLHGYDISSDVFKNFEKEGEFICFAGQSTQAVTGMYNLYRASQLRFPGEKILADARDFSGKFLKEKRAKNELLDKWIITKDLPGEVGYAVDVPWYASLPRLETRFYLEQYGGEDDVWIGKTLYRMPNVNNNTYLELAKLDYNNCQALHQQEWKNIQKWYRNCNLEEFGLGESNLLQGYYMVVASIFEPERSEERMAWAKTAVLAETIVSYFDRRRLSEEQRHAFVKEFEQASILKYADGGRYEAGMSLVGALHSTLNHISLDMLLSQGRNIHPQLNDAWHTWLRKWERGDNTGGNADAELFVCTLNLCGGGKRENAWVQSEEEVLLSHPKYEQLWKNTIRVCCQLRLYHHQKDGNICTTNTEGITTVEIESEMQELVKLVLTNFPADLDSHVKQNFLTVARSFYYTAYFSPGTINFHMSKVLFERVL